jgi:hypothetical protein
MNGLTVAVPAATITAYERCLSRARRLACADRFLTRSVLGWSPAFLHSRHLTVGETEDHDSGSGG